MTQGQRNMYAGILKHREQIRAIIKQEYKETGYGKDTQATQFTIYLNCSRCDEKITKKGLISKGVSNG